MSNPVGSITVDKDKVKNVITPKQGDYVRDQIVNIMGSIVFENSAKTAVAPEIKQADGIFGLTTNVITRYSLGDYISGNWARGFNFDASRVVQTGDRVMPRTVFENLYVIVSEEH